jgi:Leucine-rich repeat (LRR) protein
VPDAKLAAGLKFLCFRQNLLPDARRISEASCKHVLEELYFNDNRLKEIPDLSGFARLKRVEFSYNHEVSSRTRYAQALHCTDLLCVACCCVACCHGAACLAAQIYTMSPDGDCDTHVNLPLVQIRSLQPLAQLDGVHVEELYCAENKIAAIVAIGHLTKLSILELGSNRIRV